jgi:hypothetical protein
MCTVGHLHAHLYVPTKLVGGPKYHSSGLVVRDNNVTKWIGM